MLVSRKSLLNLPLYVHISSHFICVFARVLTFVFICPKIAILHFTLAKWRIQYHYPISIWEVCINQILVPLLRVFLNKLINALDVFWHYLWVLNLEIWSLYKPVIFLMSIFLLLPTFQAKPFFIISLPSIKLFHVIDGVAPLYASIKNQYEKYLALRTLATSDSKFWIIC